MTAQRLLGSLVALFFLLHGGTSGPDTALGQEPSTDWALIGVHVLPMDAPRDLMDQTVVVSRGRIRDLGPRAEVEVPEGARRVDLTGHWVLPGLVDMHVHLFSRDELPLYTAAGVTTVRNMWGWDLHLEMRREILAGELEGPRIFTAGPMLDGDPPRLRGSAALSTADEGRAEVERQARMGFDGIKVYDLISPPVFAAAVQAAGRHDLPVWAHPPEAVGVEGLLAAEVSTWEHLRGLPEAVGSENGWEGALEGGRLARLALRVREASVTVVPTLVVLEAQELTAEEKRTLLQKPLARRVPDPLRSFCCDATLDPSADLPTDVRTLRRENRFRAVNALRREGVRILAGSDTGNPWVLPGASLHDELDLLREAGMTAFEVLRAATRNAALELRATTEIGTVAVGKSADLLIVGDDPRKDLTVLRAPTAVLVRGRWSGGTPPDGASGDGSR